MNKSKVSIVIPVYNVELYLREALDSVINQTLKEIEIIVVNDGSTDNSLEIIKEYEKKDNRIKIINQENQGLSGARNSGLKIAKGEYIYFMDSDDYIDLDTLELCYKKSKDESLDFIFFDALPFSNDDIKIDINYYDRKDLDNRVLSGANYLKILLKKQKYRSPVWLCFINLKFLNEIKIKFYPKILHEDELFTPLLFLKAMRVSYINRKFFNRRMRINSIMTSVKSEKNIIGYLTVAKELNKFMKNEKNKKKVYLLKIRIQNALSSAITLLEILDSEMKQKYILEIKEEFGKSLNLKNKTRLFFPNFFKFLKKIIIVLKENVSNND